MSSTDSALMTMLKSDMSYQTQRQTVLSQNIANLDTVGYNAVDLKKPDFAKMAVQAHQQLTMARPDEGEYMEGTGGGKNGVNPTKTKGGFEVTPQGNNVSLDQEMAKINDTGMEFNMASSMYKKYNTLLTDSLGK